MIINELELREVVSKLLKERFASMTDQYRGAPDYIGKLRRWARGEKGSPGSKTVYADPAKFDIQEVYEDSIEKITANKVTVDTIMMMPTFGKSADRSSPVGFRVSKGFDKDMQLVEDRFDKLTRLSPTGDLSELLHELNTIIFPFNLGLKDVDVQPFMTWYNTKFEEENERSNESRMFLERIKREALRYYPERFEKIKVDVDAASTAGYLTDEQKKKYDLLLDKIKSSKP